MSANRFRMNSSSDNVDFVSNTNNRNYFDGYQDYDDQPKSRSRRFYTGQIYTGPSFLRRHWRKILIGAVLATAIVVAGVFTGGAVPAVALGVAAGLGVTYAVGAGLGVAAVAAGAFAVGAFISAAICRLVDYIRDARVRSVAHIKRDSNNDSPSTFYDVNNRLNPGMRNFHSMNTGLGAATMQSSSSEGSSYIRNLTAANTQLNAQPTASLLDSTNEQPNNTNVAHVYFDKNRHGLPKFWDTSESPITTQVSVHEYSSDSDDKYSLNVKNR